MKKELEVAIKAAKEAGKILQDGFGRNLKVKFKKDNSPVTRYDLKVEERILLILQRNFPDYSISSEEKGLIDKKSEYLWLVDPIDGTSNFVCGIPLFNITIALVKNKETLLCAVHNPATDELFSTEAGKGAFLNGEKIRVSDVGDLSESLVVFGRGRQKENKEVFAEVFNKVSTKIRTPRVFGSLSLDLAYVASGKFEARIDLGNGWRDHAAGALLVREAGGAATDLNGEEWNFDKNNIVASNRKIHRELLTVLNS
ncbi:MAG TPA: inositol monophosphatase [Candidatus Nanoarchaeia archaeon]